MTLSSTRRTDAGATSVSALDARARETQPGLGELVNRAKEDLTGLVQAEIQLAKTELREDVKKAAVGGALLAVAGFLGILASIILSFFLVQLLVEFGVWPWAAFLIVGVAYLLIAGILALIGKKQVSKVQPPRATIESAKGTVAALKGQRP